MATLRRRIVPQFCRGLEGGLVHGRHRARLEQPQNDILGRRAPGNGPEDIPLPVIDLYIYIGGDYRRISVETVGKRPVRRSNRRRDGPPLVVPLLMADPLEKQSETILY